ncbi:MAG: nuclease-related domain-containing protein [Pseudomonadota bacterium]
MNDIVAALPSWLPLAVAAMIVLILLLVLLLARRSGSVQGRLRKALERVSYDTMSGIVVPKADEGEIQIDLVLLTEHGILVLDYKDVAGVVFGSDRMQDWTVINGDRRFTFANPQHALLDRVAAVRQVVRDVPVDGQVLFGDSADFTKGTPQHVASLKALLEHYPKVNRKRPPEAVLAFRAAWERLRAEALDTQAGRLFKA